MSRIVTGQGIYQKGQTKPQKASKPMRKVSKKKAKEKHPLREFAEGKQCQMRSEWCNGDSETVVLCHSRRRAGAGKGQKPYDFWGYHGCSSCHAHEHLISDSDLYDAIRRTQYFVFQELGTLTPLTQDD